MQKILLIAGCSHAAGSEVDGSEDSEFNRLNSFGGVLSKKLDRKPINIASHGATNHTIARSVLEWFQQNYDPNTMQVAALVAWSESSRMELPVYEDRKSWYDRSYPCADWNSKTSRYYFRINHGWKGGNEWEKQIIPQYQEFMAENAAYLEIQSANLVLQMQYFFVAKNINYIMCNTMHMFNNNYRHLDFYLSNIDESSFINFNDNDQSFYWKYKNLGFVNSKAKYWHHGIEAHSDYANILYQHYTKKYSSH